MVKLSPRTNSESQFLLRQPLPGTSCSSVAKNTFLRLSQTPSQTLLSPCFADFRFFDQPECIRNGSHHEKRSDRTAVDVALFLVTAKPQVLRLRKVGLRDRPSFVVACKPRRKDRSRNEPFRPPILGEKHILCLSGTVSRCVEPSVLKSLNEHLLQLL